MPKFSIITVVYNNATQIETCINSVLSQKYRNFEYIIIDGSSTDGTMDIVNKYRSQLAHVISEKDKGISDAFNKGLALATGEIVGLINSDDWLEPDCLEHVAAIEGTPDIMYGKLRQIRKDSIIEMDADHRNLRLHMTLNHPATFVRKDTYQRFGFFNPTFRIAMDYEFILRCFAGGASFVYLPEVLANMRIAGASESNWMRGIKEVKDAKYLHLEKSIRYQLYYLLQMIAIPISRLTELQWLKPIKKIYTRFSTIKRKEIAG